jgi:hypothetical protein
VGQIALNCGLAARSDFGFEGAEPELPRALNAAVQSEYARLAGMSPAAVTAAIKPYLPILRAFALAERATNPARRERLIQHVEAALRLEN